MTQLPDYPICYSVSVSRALKAHILLVLTTVVWGVTFVLIKEALADISPLLFNAVRLTLAAACLCLIFRKAVAGMTAAALRAGTIVGVFLWAGFEFQICGLKLTTPSKSAFVTGLSVVLVPVFLALLWRRMIGRWTALGVGTACLGLYLLTVPEAFFLAGINRGDLLTLGCAAGFALQIITMGQATAKHPFQQIAVVEAVVCAGLMWITAPLLEKPHLVWSPAVIWAIAVTGLLGTGAAFVVQAWAQQFTPAAHTALIFILEPVFAWITSYVVLQERLGFRAAAGAGLILTGVLISELKGVGAGGAAKN
jgi:drug/metabolite transporter (DMT)-like permease